MQEPKTILVVEDNPTMQRLVVLFAKKLGLNAVTAGTAAEAVSTVEQGRSFDLVLMDWSLPDQSGLECAQRIRELLSDRGKRVPIIAMTASLMPGDRETCLQTGLDDFLGKPFSMAEFNRLLERWLATTPAVIPFPESKPDDQRSAGSA